MKTILCIMLFNTLLSLNCNPNITELNHATASNPAMITTIHWLNLNPERIAELKKMREEYETTINSIVNSQDTEEQQEMIQYQIGTINIILENVIESQSQFNEEGDQNIDN